MRDRPAHKRHTTRFGSSVAVLLEVRGTMLEKSTGYPQESEARIPAARRRREEGTP
jgi:hypothetical protein